LAPIRVPAYAGFVTLTYMISQSLIDKYAHGRSATRMSQVKRLHENVRYALENWDEKKFDTFLQGSYRNGTAIADINDVDIVAQYKPWYRPIAHEDWTWLLAHVAQILTRTTLIQAPVSLGDKCVKLGGSPKADIVPSIGRSPYSSSDPVYIHWRRAYEDIANYPRVHYDNGVKKQGATDDAYKPTVRLFKRWAGQYANLVAPSFYIECAVYSVPDDKFDSYLPLSFASVGVKLLEYTRSTVINSVAGDKDILVANEWRPEQFEDFPRRLSADLKHVLAAMRSTSEADANYEWRLAFGDY
jgi:hypothetical protein